jgi:hypothetical protein
LPFDTAQRILSRVFETKGAAMWKPVRLPVLAIALCLLAAEVSADISVRLSNEQLADSSSAIVIGRATSFQSRWVDRTLVTAVTVQITETLKGTASTQIEVLLPGGIDASRRIKVGMTYPGAPQMQNGEEVFLFLAYDGDLGGYVVNGFAQGKFSIVTQQGTRFVGRDLRGSQLVDGPGITRGTATLTPLDVFRQEIVGYVAR